MLPTFVLDRSRASLHAAIQIIRYTVASNARSCG